MSNARNEERARVEAAHYYIERAERIAHQYGLPCTRAQSLNKRYGHAPSPVLNVYAAGSLAVRLAVGYRPPATRTPDFDWYLWINNRKYIEGDINAWRVYEHLVWLARKNEDGCNN